ncbi:single-strand binding protein (plasmid) [Deinococcus proteolyticus MRP]|uniref:Single-stranded DNA-binding protein n=1 Tax=Deinococcus proteolyticus (strain ATCC 35074 / DSM 20540 / JCM 6276 / NBRC 101906 / NCIMB 13154 / VKM Ac-1939 / CCM 2703 / MRP) TaxID=693977 RepID=F0RQ90_DEIPM|nr:single-stranded DNA-binding protein [Deinococcus proteolyticus]ADY27449.1 single-strand binding protein [Deinococcus proteolyticus MRP]
MNNIQLTGSFTRDPELRYTESGLAVFEGTVAGEEHTVTHDGKPLSLPFYHRVTLLGRYAEYVAQRGYTAGSPVAIQGKLEQNAYTDGTGVKRNQARVRISQIEGLAGEFETVADQGGGVRMKGGQNSLTVSGNLTRDAELRYTPGGDAVLNLAIAINERWTDKDGERQEKVHFFEVSAWRELAEAHKDLVKGDPVMISGRLSNESWTDKDGNKQRSSRIEALDLLPLQRGAQVSDRQGQGRRSARPEVVQAPAAAAPDLLADEDMPF